METKRISRPVMVVLAVIAAAGAAAWIYQTMFGLGVTGMNNGTPGACTSPRSCSSSACPPAV